jgi:hypothetical protein
LVKQLGQERDVKLILEMFLWALENTEMVRYHHLHTDITESLKDPDAIMNDQLERFGLINGKGARYAHSTSWRYQAGHTLLTYLVWVDGQVLGQLPTKRLFIPSVACPESRGPLSPRPESICEAHVLVHGLRHLRHLALDQKDVVAAEILECPETCCFLNSLEPAPSGRLASLSANALDGTQLVQ